METSERWVVHVDEGVLVVEFPRGTGLAPADGEAILDRLCTLATEQRVEAVVLVVRTTRPCSDTGRETLRATGRIGLEHGVSRFAIVAERPKRRYLERTMDINGIDVEPFNDNAAALRWAKSPSESELSVETSS